MPKHSRKPKSHKGIVRLRRNNLTRAMNRSLGIELGSLAHPDDRLVELVERLQSINTSKPDAQLNETSIADNNGGRILL